MLSRSSANVPLLATGSPAQRPARLWPARRRRLWRLLPPLLALLLGWEALYHSGWLPAFVLPAPAAVARRTVEVVGDGSLWPHLQATLSAALAGYLLAVLFGTSLGYALARWRALEELLAPYLAASQAIPVVAVAPLLVLWLGYGLQSKIVVAALIVFFPILSTTIVALHSLPQPLREEAIVSGTSRWQLFRYVELPLALPVLFGGLKAALALATTGAVVGEFVGARHGLGVLINIGRGAYDAPLIFTALGMLGGLTLTLYVLAGLLERWLIDWQE